MCFLPLALNTQNAPGQFTPVISEESYYISSIRNLDDGTSAVVSSFVTFNTIPLLLAIFIVLLLELAVVKRFNIESIVNAIYQSFSASFYQNLFRHSTWFCLILMIILMFPVYIFNASFSTQTIVGNNEVKIETLRDVIDYGKIPFFIEGISMYDWFKAKVTKEYAEIYERSKSNGLDKPYELGPIPIFRPADRMVLPVSTLGVKIAPLVALGIHGPNQVQYFSERPFHRSVQALLLGFKTPKSIKRRVKILTQRIAQAAIATKLEADIYIESILSFHPASLHYIVFNFHKSEIQLIELCLMFIMAKSNLTVGAFSVFGQGFVEENGQTVPVLKSLKRLAALMTDYGPFNMKLHLPESGQLGVLTETGYRDGVLGLMQEGKVELCFLPMALDTQKAPGQFTSALSEESYYIHSMRNLGGGNTSSLTNSFVSVNTIPILLAILIVLLLELAVIKRFNIKSIVDAIYQSFGISFHQNLSRHLTWFRLILMIIIMFPVFLFNASFNTQTIIGTNDVKINTLRDVIKYDKIPYFFEGISMYDWFKAKVSKDYGDIYKRSKSNGFDKPYELGFIPVFRSADRMVTFISTLGVKLAPLGASELHEPNQVQYISERPFHRSVQALLLGFKTPKSTKRRIHFITQRLAQSGISQKLEADVYVEFILSFYPASLFDFYKFQIPRNSLEVNWKSLNYRTFCEIFYGYILLLVLVLIVQFIQLLSVLLSKRKKIEN